MRKYRNNQYKTKEDALGYRIDCINYVSCPLCYGCKNYSSAIIECEKCAAENPQMNICNNNLHSAKNISKMVKRMRITIC